MHGRVINAIFDYEKKGFDIKYIIMESKFMNMLEFSCKQTKLKIEKVDAEIFYFRLPGSFFFHISI